MPSSKIAVEAKNTKPWRIVLPSEPLIETSASRLSYAPSMACASAIDVVNGQKLDMVFPATDAKSTTIGVHYPQFYGSIPLTVLFNDVGFMGLIISSSIRSTLRKVLVIISLTLLSLFFWANLAFMRLPIKFRLDVAFFLIYLSVYSLILTLFIRKLRHNNTASFQLAALTRQAGQRQLEAIIS